MARAVLADDGRLLFWCPGCNEHHGVPVAMGDVRGWSWNASTMRPTLSPSILVRFTVAGTDRVPSRQYDGQYPCKTSEGICHSFVREGMIEYLGDCTHALAGQTVELPDDV
jgi:hypothetical protein